MGTRDIGEGIMILTDIKLRVVSEDLVSDTVVV